jgi:hypothetical protein
MTNLTVNQAATGHGDPPAVRLDGHVLSYAELDAAAGAVAGDQRAGHPFPGTAARLTQALRWHQADTGAW